ncbi:hypothetical protein A0H81_06940 [Grifola frondosa]|uniref:Uncharacterized protein n=1 Tax=Grifola frondosa TaxID=5627 RepID=A0A1C7M7A4_GRIFR|nr:hypothetical protein A0H81_06940 [Grifola frondosa]
MHAPLSLLVLALAGTSLALPAPPRRREPGAWCNNLGGGAFDIAYNFTLAAYNSTGTNTNSTGVPLVLGQAGATTGEEIKALSTYASFPYNDFPNLSLLEGALIPNGQATASDANVTAGEPPNFVVTNLNPPAPAQIYCAIADTDPAGGGTGYPILAVHGDPDSFSLCATGTSPRAQNNVVYKASANALGYDFSSCYPVRLQLVGLY